MINIKNIKEVAKVIKNAAITISGVVGIIEGVKLLKNAIKLDGRT